MEKIFPLRCEEIGNEIQLKFRNEPIEPHKWIYGTLLQNPENGNRKGQSQVAKVMTCYMK